MCTHTYIYNSFLSWRSHVIPMGVPCWLSLLCKPIYTDTHDNMYIGEVLNVPDNLPLEIIALSNLHKYTVVHFKAW